MRRSCLAAALAVAATASHAAVIDFESIPLNEDGENAFVGKSYVEDGFVLSMEDRYPQGFVAIGTPRHNDTGSTALVNVNTVFPNDIFPTSTAETTLRHASGESFSLLSIEISELFKYDDRQTGPATHVGVVGRNEAGNTLVQAWLRLDGNFGMEKVSFDGWNNLSSVILFSFEFPFQFDNIVVEASAQPPAPVPLPAGGALLLGGLAGLAALRRKTRA